MVGCVDHSSLFDSFATGTLRGAWAVFSFEPLCPAFWLLCFDPCRTYRGHCGPDSVFFSSNASGVRPGGEPFYLPALPSFSCRGFSWRLWRLQPTRFILVFLFCAGFASEAEAPPRKFLGLPKLLFYSTHQSCFSQDGNISIEAVAAPLREISTSFLPSLLPLI